MRILHQQPICPVENHTYVTTCKLCGTKFEFKLGEARISVGIPSGGLNALEYLRTLRLTAQELGNKLIQVQCPSCSVAIHAKYNSYKKPLPQLLIDKLRTCW